MLPGIFIYDHLGGRRILPRSHAVVFDMAGSVPLKEVICAVSVSGCATDDAPGGAQCVDAAERAP